MASDLKLALELKANVEQFTRAVQGAAAELERRLAEIEAAAKRSGTGTEKATGKVSDALKETAQAAAGAGREFEEALKRLDLRRHGDVEKEIREIEQAFNALARSGKLSAKELAQANLRAKEKVAALRDEMNGWLQSLARVKEKLAVAAGGLYGVTRAVTSATEASSRFQQAMAEVGTLLDDTTAMEELTSRMRELAKEFGTSQVEQAKALYQVISAGAQDAAQAVEILTAANKLAVGGVTDVKTAVDGLTSVLNAYGEAAGSAQDVSDAFFVAVKAGKTTVGELASAIGQVAPLAAQAGVRLDELLAAVAALTKSGLSTAEAMTQIRGAISAVLKPTGEAQETAQELGLAFDAAALKSQGLAGFLAEVARRAGGNTEVLAKLFGQVEALNGVLALTGNQAGDFAQILDAMASKAGAAEKAFGAMADTPQMASKRFKAAMEDLQTALGQAVTALTPFLELFTRVVNVLNEAPTWARGTMLAIGALGTAMLSVAPVAGQLAASMRLLAVSAADQAKTLGGLAGALDRVARGSGALLGKIAAALPVLGMAAVATTGLAVAAADLATELARVSRAAETASEAERRAGEARAEAIGFVKAQILGLEAYRDTALRTAKEVSYLGEVERERYAKRLEGLRRLLDMERRLADLSGDEAGVARLRQQIARVDEALRDLAVGAGRAEAALARGVGPAALKLADAMEDLIAKGQSASEALKALGKPLGRASVEDLQDLSAAFSELERRGVASSREIQKAWSDAISGLSADELQRLGVAMEAAFGQGAQGAERLADVANTLLDAALKKLGVDVEEVRSGLSGVGSEALTSFRVVVEQARKAGLAAKQQAEVIGKAFRAALAKAKNTKDIEALQQALKESGLQGEALAKAMGQAEKALEDMGRAGKLAGQEASEGIRDIVAQAGRAATAQELAALRDKLTSLFAQGKISMDAYYQGLGAVRDRLAALRDAAQEAGENQQTLGEASEAAARGIGLVSTEAAAAGEALRDAFGEEAEAMLRDLNERMAELHGWMGLLTQAEVRTNLASTWYVMRTGVEAVDDLIERLREAGAASDDLQREAEEALRTYAHLGDERLEPLRAALEDARRRTEDLRQEAAETLAELRDELDRLRGDQAAIEQRRYETRKAELEAKLREAQQAKDYDAVQQLRESLRLLDQIHRTRMAQIEAERKAEAQRHAEAMEHRRREALPERAREEMAITRRTRSPEELERMSLERTGPFAPRPERVVRIEFGGPGGPSGTFSEGDAERLLRLLEEYGMRSSLSA